MNSSESLKSTTICLVASDPASGSALLPVSREMVRRRATVHVLAAGPSERVFSPAPPEITVDKVDDRTALRDIARMLQEKRADLLLSGAGTYNLVEHTTRLAAKSLALPVVALVDYINEAEARFRRSQSPDALWSIPDFVCAPNDSSAAELTQILGPVRDRCFVTGMPHLEQAALDLTSLAGAKYELREKFGQTEDEMVGVLFSEPYWVQPDGEVAMGEGSMVDTEGRPRFGYTPDAILSAIIKSLSKCAEQLQRRVHLIVKPHPREYSPKLLPIINGPLPSGLDVRLLENANPRELIVAADIVFGMSTVALMEAAAAGRPSLSVQIGLQKAAASDPCMGNVLGITTPIFTQEQLDDALTTIFTNGVATVEGRLQDDTLYRGASRRVVDVVVTALQTWRSSPAKKSDVARNVRLNGA